MVKNWNYLKTDLRRLIPSVKAEELVETADRPTLFRRIAAAFYDGLLLLGVLFIATFAVLPFNAGQALTGGGLDFVFPLYLLLISFLFFGWFWTHGGQTLGLKAWRIRLETSNRQPVTWRHASLRFLGLLVTLGIDSLLLVFNKRYRPLHDRLSQTSLYVYPSKPAAAQ